MTLPPSDTAQPNPFGSLLRSRKFLVVLLDLAASMALYFGGKYGGADSTDIVFLVGVLQPAFLALIHGITEEDKAKLAANAIVEVAQVEAMVDSAVPQLPQNEQQLPPGQMRDWPPRVPPDRPIQPRR